MEKKYRESWEYPTDTDSFEKLRTRGRVYVDKTKLIYNMTRNECVFLSRPRRFGKSLLCSTLKAYFLGKKELFSGLEIEKLEKDWLQYPVFHFNMSGLKDKSSEAAKDELFFQVGQNARNNGVEPPEALTPGSMFQRLVIRAHEQKGLPAVIIIDEYDAALLHIQKDTEAYDEMQSILREFYITCKICSEHLRFVFITGITKFSHVSIFSELNHLNNITMNEEFATICGITEEELHSQFGDDVERLAERNGMTRDEMFDLLKAKYDGFHFGTNPADIYNPYSMMLVFATGALGDYWFDSATPSFLIEMLKPYKFDLVELNGLRETIAADFSYSIMDQVSALPLLFYSGYLTIKGFERGFETTYTLGIPNQEVRVGLYSYLLRTTTPMSDSGLRQNLINTINKSLKAGNPDDALKALQSFLSGVPYMYEGKEILEDLEKLEALHQRDLYILFNGMGLNLQTEVTQAKGRVDMVVWLPDAIYIMEFKMRGTATNALNQIDKNHYDKPYLSDPRPKVKIGIRFTAQKHTITSWKTAVSH